MKAYLKAMGVHPWHEVQPDFPADMLGIILSTYFGGRSEVRIRREMHQVMLCDFLSMYPTVCTLMGLWDFVIADGMNWRDATLEIREFIDRISLDDLQHKDLWPRLRCLVQVDADKDIFPVRARYGDEQQATIGLNYISSNGPLWFTLADCIASKILNGKSPNIHRAIIFEPGEPQQGLHAINIAGKSDYAINPNSDDFYRRLIELRQSVKTLAKSASDVDRPALETEQNALKIAANATSYGIFVEVNVEERAKAETSKAEKPGFFFHPLLATLITGAARLMLAITERLVMDRGLDWAFCDTESMAIARSEDCSAVDFQERVNAIVGWFETLNPYNFTGSILKIEDVNYSLADGSRFEPLFCWAVSAKRYALFNLDSDRLPIIRKASAHGLGHLRAPYDASNPSDVTPRPSGNPTKIGVELWQHDFGGTF